MKKLTLTLRDTNHTTKATAGLTLSGEQAEALAALLAQAKSGLFFEHAAHLDIKGLGRGVVSLNVAELC